MSDQVLTTGQIISIADGRLACDIGDVYKALDGLLDDALMTHQLPRAGRYAAPFIKEHHPWVEDLPPLDLSGVDGNESRNAVLAWVEQITAQHGHLHEVPDLSDQWVRRDPLAEIFELVAEKGDTE